jgi:hypothetical protein
MWVSKSKDFLSSVALLKLKCCYGNKIKRAETFKNYTRKKNAQKFRPA